MILGFIGLGMMGAGMVRNLARRFTVRVYDNRAEAVLAATEAGCEPAATAADVAKDADVVITMLPGPTEIEAVMIGAGVGASMRPGALWIDMSSSSLPVLQRVVAAHAGGEWSALDAPVTGGVPGAAAGTLQIFVGGLTSDFDRAFHVLSEMGNPERILHVGPQGTGYAVKLALNLGYFLNAMAAAEVMTLGVKAGVDIDVLHQALTGSGATSAFLERDMAENVFNGDYKEYFRLALALKDVRLAVDLGRDVGVPMELSALVEQSMRRALLTYGDGGQLLAIKQQEEVADVRLRRTGVGG
ncbi:MAG TPA: NAD(P)-dependent oxidoreductase [Nakamurella multipartita]|nr:NAD(P)-dependent oxidoreductase [Nakamurella multipartita]